MVYQSRIEIRLKDHWDWFGACCLLRLTQPAQVCLSMHTWPSLASLQTLSLSRFKKNKKTSPTSRLLSSPGSSNEVSRFEIFAGVSGH